MNAEEEMKFTIFLNKTQSKKAYVI